MKSNFSKLNVKKKDFLEALAVVYKDASEDYLTALINGLIIIRKSMYHEHIDYSSYKGLISI